MLLKPLLSVLLISAFPFDFVAAVVKSGAASSAIDSAAISRTLQSSILCLASGTDFTDCCPSGADPNDGACTLLSCVNFDNVTISDDCDCSQLEVACGQVAMFADLVANLSEMCIAIDNCCGNADKTSYSSTTSNSDFDQCMASTIEESGLAVPDINALLPGGDGTTDGQSSASGTSNGLGTSPRATTTTTSTTAVTTSTKSTSSQKKTVELAVNTNDATESIAHYVTFSMFGLSLAMLFF